MKWFFCTPAPACSDDSLLGFSCTLVSWLCDISLPTATSAALISACLWRACSRLSAISSCVRGLRWKKHLVNLVDCSTVIATQFTVTFFNRIGTAALAQMQSSDSIFPGGNTPPVLAVRRRATQHEYDFKASLHMLFLMRFRCDFAYKTRPSLPRTGI